MRELLRQFANKTVRVYTISGVESYLGIIQEVGDQYVALRSYFKEDVSYISLAHIESFKVEPVSENAKL
ncbi:MAG TPA: hypothetical protein PLG17_02030 [Thermodesulfobacteriota bacterium]|nr:hypothetical protein [Deltaproteobacteria bacterium]HNR12093.1 hypothetical protein [Thermodesulfobacteriota bacterium]HNU70833.1 hypothetical protein [Thermodesulfobacteriota bacterium]HQO77271.1 hypothetical protein [Thermodesulfobacteriota bacterium]